MKRRFFGLLVIVGLCFVTCGNEPPPDFYNGTPEDDAAIDAILNDTLFSKLLVTTDQFVTTYSAMTIPPVTFPQADSFFRVDSPLIKVFVDQIADSLSEFLRFRDLWYAKDTTCTVRLFDTFDVSGMIHVNTRYTAHYDLPETTATGDTLWRIGTTDIDATPVDDYEDYVGEGVRFIFLEPERVDGVITEPFEWILKRISYGTYYFPARGNSSIPTINFVILGEDTVYARNTDSLFTGHAMNRLKHIDSLLAYTANTTLDVRVVLTGDVTADQCVFFASSGNGWEQLIGGTGTLTVTGSGITNLYFKVITQESYYYYFPNRGYFAVAWLIPVRIN